MVHPLPLALEVVLVVVATDSPTPCVARALMLNSSESHLHVSTSKVTVIFLLCSALYAATSSNNSFLISWMITALSEALLPTGNKTLLEEMILLVVFGQHPVSAYISTNNTIVQQLRIFFLGQVSGIMVKYLI